MGYLSAPFVLLIAVKNLPLQEEWRIPFLFAGVVGIGTAVVVLLMLDQPVSDADETRAETKSNIVESEPPSSISIFSYYNFCKSFSKGVHSISYIFQPSTLLLLAGNFLIYFILKGMTDWLGRCDL